MVLFEIIAPMLWILVAAFIITQCLVPTTVGRPWFPMFRRNWNVRSHIEEAKEDNATDELEDKLTALKTKTPKEN